MAPTKPVLALKAKPEFHYFKWAVKLPIHVYVGIIVETTNVFILLLCIKSTRNLRRLWNSKLKYKLAQKSVLRIQDFLGSTWQNFMPQKKCFIGLQFLKNLRKQVKWLLLQA